MKTTIPIALLWICAVLAQSAKSHAGPNAPDDAPPPDKAPPADAPAAPPAGGPAGDSGPAFATMDLDKDDGVTWNEFLVAQAVAMGKPAAQAAMLPAKDQTRIKKMFREADADRSDILTEKEWTEYGQEQIASKAPPSPGGKSGDNERGLDRNLESTMKRIQREQVKQMMRNMSR